MIENMTCESQTACVHNPTLSLTSCVTWGKFPNALYLKVSQLKNGGNNTT